jgi:hypothetical protein
MDKIDWGEQRKIIERLELEVRHDLKQDEFYKDLTVDERIALGRELELIQVVKSLL